MRLVLYYGYILTGVAQNNGPASWRPHVRIACSSGQQEFTMEDAGCFTSQRAAEDYAIGMGKHWVNNRLHAGMFANIRALH
jgi:hypothetical protein